jgi:hypothetical protein
VVGSKSEIRNSKSEIWRGGWSPLPLFAFSPFLCKRSNVWFIWNFVRSRVRAPEGRQNLARGVSPGVPGQEKKTSRGAATDDRRRRLRLTPQPESVAPPGLIIYLTLILGLTPQANNLSPLRG